MNRILLVGNGFDLACGLKSSYEDFLVGYLQYNITFAFISVQTNADSTETLVNDQLMEIKWWGEKWKSNEFEAKSKVLYDASRISTIVCLPWVQFEHIDKTKWSTVKSDLSGIEIRIKSKFFLQLLKNKNWTDIEGLYFDTLLKYYNEAKESNYEFHSLMRARRTTDNHPIYSLVDLNEDLQFIKEKLGKYLDGRCRAYNPENSKYPHSRLEELEQVKEKEKYKLFFPSMLLEVENVLILNFNYTNILDQHLKELSLSKTKEIQIHGTTDSPENMIFGYGDDTHPLYSELELNGLDEFLINLKSFKYPLNQKYIDTIHFLNSKAYEVQVIGHSLGLSDRVLLKSIFEHDNCKCIRIFHRGRPDEKKQIQYKYMALARHFDNKMILRNRIFPFLEEDKIY